MAVSLAQYPFTLAMDVFFKSQQSMIPFLTHLLLEKPSQDARLLRFQVWILTDSSSKALNESELFSAGLNMTGPISIL